MVKYIEYIRSSGLGLATTKLLSEKEANVAILDIQEPPETLVGTKFWQCDVSNDARVEECIKGIVEWSREESKPIGGAICCAGVAIPGRVHLLTGYSTNSGDLPRWLTVLYGDLP